MAERVAKTREALTSGPARARLQQLRPVLQMVSFRPERPACDAHVRIRRLKRLQGGAGETA